MMKEQKVKKEKKKATKCHKLHGLIKNRSGSSVAVFPLVVVPVINVL